MMNYTQALEQIQQLKIGNSFSDMEGLCEEIGIDNVIFIPKDYEYDLISAYVEAILKEHKFHVGRYTEYALNSPLGRILFDKKAISQKDFAKYTENVIDEGIYVEELYIKVALLYFKDKNLDFVILPSDKEKDFEKIEEKFRERVITELDKTSGDVAVELLRDKQVDLKANLIEKAINKCNKDGKFELLKKRPYYIADGADDEKSVRILMGKLQYYYPENNYIFIVGTCKKNYERLVRESALMASHIITVTPPENLSAIQAMELAKEYLKLNPNITNASGMEEALEIAGILADKETVVVAFGSHLIIEKFRQQIKKK